MSQATEWLGWYCCPADLRVRRTGEPIEAGAVHRYDGQPVLCKSGLHASRCILDALGYAIGGMVARVKLAGTIVEGDDKACGSERHVIAVVDATATLHEFACDVAEQTLQHERDAGREPHADSWRAIEVKRLWLVGQASDSDLAAAEWAAYSAAEWAAWSVARSAAWSAAWLAAWSAARSAAWSAASQDLEARLLALIAAGRVA